MAKLDRLPSFDPQSRNFPIRAVVETKPHRSYTWACGVDLDQGQEGACVGFGWSHELAARPVVVHGIDNRSAEALYKRAQQVDEWPGDNYDGTSVIAGAKVVQSEGYIGEYRWAFGLDDVLLALGYHGPVVLGLNWRDSMFEPDANGRLDVSGKVAGGHCILADGVSVRHKLVRLHNSWGPGWGLFGDAFVTWEDLDTLLRDEGEACVPMHRTKGGNGAG